MPWESYCFSIPFPFCLPEQMKRGQAFNLKFVIEFKPNTEINNEFILKIIEQSRPCVYPAKRRFRPDTALYTRKYRRTGRLSG